MTPSMSTICTPSFCYHSSIAIAIIVGEFCMNHVILRKIISFIKFNLSKLPFSYKMMTMMVMCYCYAYWIKYIYGNWERASVFATKTNLTNISLEYNERNHFNSFWLENWRMRDKKICIINWWFTHASFRMFVLL